MNDQQDDNGQTKLDKLGMLMLQQQMQNQAPGIGGIVSQMLGAYAMGKMHQKPPAAYSGTGAAPNLSGSLPDAYSGITAPLDPFSYYRP